MPEDQTDRQKASVSLGQKKRAIEEEQFKDYTQHDPQSLSFCS